METSALESLNVENAFTEVPNQIYRVVSRKALDIGDGPTAAVPSHVLHGHPPPMHAQAKLH